jgi:hypothetical protein
MRNDQATKNDRILDCSWMLANQHHEWISINEFGFQIGTQRQFGRAPRGESVRRMTPLTRPANVSVYLVVRANYGLIYWDHWGSACDRDTFTISMDPSPKKWQTFRSLTLVTFWTTAQSIMSETSPRRVRYLEKSTISCHLTLRC